MYHYIMEKNDSISVGEGLVALGKSLEQSRANSSSIKKSGKDVFDQYESFDSFLSDCKLSPDGVKVLHENDINDLALLGEIVLEAYNISLSDNERRAFPEVFIDISEVKIPKMDLFKIKSKANLLK